MKFDLGFLGGGQLARMSIMAAQRMGLRCLSLDPSENSPASQIAPCIRAKLDDAEALASLFEQCDHVTLENEFIPGEAIREGLKMANMDEGVLMPGLKPLETIQDKLVQRQALALAGVPSPRAVAILDGDDAIAEIGFPMVLKARFGGYDGRGTRYAKNLEEFEEHRYLWASGGWLAEEYVPFRRELAVMVFRSVEGAGCFPTMETVQANHICDLVFPAGTDASGIAMAAVEAIEGHGLFGVELFELEDGSVQVNEMAPRPHNTGHYTLDWGGISQFEQHVRLVMGWPLGEISGEERPVCMANLMGASNAGDHRAATHAALAIEGIHVHWYGKHEARPGRKMGHLNSVGSDCVTRAKVARERFYSAWFGAP
jgi:5-(carboxyamino)imidazole ribonucleotide synthase